MFGCEEYGAPLEGETRNMQILIFYESNEVS